MSETIHQIANKAWLKFREEEIYKKGLDDKLCLNDEQMFFIEGMFLEAWFKGFEFKFGGKL